MNKLVESVVQVDVGQINPAPYNPRAISDDAFAGLCKSIELYGIVRPLVVNKTNNVLVGGHQTLKAAKALGYQKVPVVYVSLDPMQEKALNITLNNPSISGYYTEDLQDILSELKSELDGFDELNLDHLEVGGDWSDAAADAASAADIAAYNEDNDTFDIKIEGVKPSDKADLLAKVQASLEGTGYKAEAY